MEFAFLGDFMKYFFSWGTKEFNRLTTAFTRHSVISYIRFLTSCKSCWKCSSDQEFDRKFVIKTINFANNISKDGQLITKKALVKVAESFKKQDPRSQERQLFVKWLQDAVQPK